MAKLMITSIDEGLLSKTAGLQETDPTKEEQDFNMNRMPWKFPNDSFDEIRLECILEQAKEVVDVMDEVYRVCKNNAKIFIVVPYWNSSSAYTNPKNKQRFSFSSFDYFKKKFNIIQIKSVPHKFFRWIPNVSVRWLIRNRNPFIKSRDMLSLVLSEINQYLYVELLVVK